MLDKVNLKHKLSLFDELYHPRTVAQFNGHDVMVARLLGDFVWHHHDDTDDLFLVLQGQLTIRLRSEERQWEVQLGPGELYVVPRGMEHQPSASEEVHCLLLERAGTPNTGNPETATPRIEI